MTQEQLAEKIGVARQSVSKWETDSAIPDIEKLKLLAEIFEVSITELLGMECEEDTKRKDEKERIEHCQKEIKRWKRYAIVSIAISAIFLAACIGGSIYVRYFIIEEKSNNTEAQTTQIVQQETDRKAKRNHIGVLQKCTLFRGRKDISEIKVCSGSGQRRNTNDRSC